MSKKTSIYLTDEVRALLRCPPRGPSEAVGIVAERYTALLAPEKKAPYYAVFGRRVERYTERLQWDYLEPVVNPWWGTS